jgi:hypothetical protein
MTISRKGQYTGLITSIRLLGSEYDFNYSEYELQSGFWAQVDNITYLTIRSLVENLDQKYIGPTIEISTIKQKIVIYVRKMLPVFKNDIDPLNPTRKVITRILYNGDSYKLMSQQIIMESLYCYTAQLEDINETITA